MGLTNITQFLSRFANLTPPDDSLKNYVRELLKDELSVDIKKEDVKITNTTIYLTTSSVVKNEIFLRKSALLEKIQDFSGKRKIEDIK